jgi:predicted DNA-binding transcriptional regulator AlpA
MKTYQEQYPPQPPIVGDEFLSTPALARILCRAPATLEKDRCAGKGPPHVKIGRQILYRASDVRRWIAEQPSRHSTSEGGR